jgi:uncharacterized protein (TIGR02266 family)
MPTNHKTVLIADSNQTDNMRISILLKRLGYSVFTVPNCSDAINKITNSDPDVVLINIRMTDIDSTACLGHIKKKKAMPVIMTGEKTDAQALADLLKRGAAAYIFKPINPTSLYCVIQKLTEKTPRQNLRVRIIFRVTMTYLNMKRVSFASTLSENGVFIRTVKPIPVGTKVSLSMDLPSEKPIEAEGVVIYIVKSDKNRLIEPGMCIRFSHIDKNIQLGLRRFIEEQLTCELDPNLDL